MTDKEFIDSLRPEQKTYTVFERPYWTKSGDWDGVVYFSKWSFFIRKLFRKLSKQDPVNRLFNTIE